MPSPTRRPGRLPARVYWFRRFLVLGTACALVFAVARMLGGGGDETPAETATVAGAGTGAEPTQAAPTRPIGPLPPNVTTTASAGGAPVVEVEPDGPCSVEDITVTPDTPTSLAGRAVPLVLQLTGIRPACTFEVGAKTLVAKVSASKGRVWSTQDCPSSVPKMTVVVRSASPTAVQISWNGRASDSTCSRTTDWAVPGNYQVLAAAIGSEPTAGALKLTKPPRPVVIKTVTPTPKKKATSKPTTPDTGDRRVGR